MNQHQLSLANENVFVCDKCNGRFLFQKVDVGGVTHRIGYVEKDGGYLCYNCQVVHELEDMRDSHKAVLYLSGMLVVNYARTLRFPVIEGGIKFSHIKLSRKREYQKARVWFAGPDGARWSGYAFNNQRLICHRLKRQDKNITPLNPESYIVHYNYETQQA